MTDFLTMRSVSWAALAFAILAWIGVGYLAWAISEAAQERGARISSLDREASERETALRLHALARETRSAREKLDELSRADLLEIIGAIEALARDAGAQVRMEGAPSISASESSPLRTVSFTVSAQGSFERVALAAALLESLPLPSAVDELRLERIPESPSKATWHLVAKARVFTTADMPAI